MFTVIEIIFWTSLFIIFYTYFGYGILLFFLVRVKRLFTKKSRTIDDNFRPTVSFIVPCFNEEDFIEEKIKNSLDIEYPKDKLEIIFITDGSTDGTMDIIKKYPEIKLLHEDRRAGKSAAENRAIQHAKNDIVVFCDANTYLPKEVLLKIVRHYADESVGAVSGEKRIYNKDADTASGAGEGIYWKYESFLKKYDAELKTLVGAAGELFSLRKKYYTHLEEDTVLDDFIQSMRIAGQGKKVVYDADAYAMETASESVKEELKRKIRICAGAWQSMIRLKYLLNPFRDFVLFFQYLSHRVLRWTLTPFLMLLVIPLNVLLVLFSSGLNIYLPLLAAQFIFYTMAILGWILANKEIKVKILFIPYYFFIMNYAAFAGLFRYFKGNQAAAWERSKRAQK